MSSDQNKDREDPKKHPTSREDRDVSKEDLAACLDDDKVVSKKSPSIALEPTVGSHNSTDRVKIPELKTPVKRQDEGFASFSMPWREKQDLRQAGRRSDEAVPTPINSSAMTRAPTSTAPGGRKARMHSRTQPSSLVASSTPGAFGVSPSDGHVQGQRRGNGVTPMESDIPLSDTSWQEKRRMFRHNNNRTKSSPSGDSPSLTNPGGFAVSSRPTTNDEPTEQNPSRGTGNTSNISEMPLLEATVVGDNDNDEERRLFPPSPLNIPMAVAQPEKEPDPPSLWMTYRWQILLLVGMAAALVGGVTSTVVVARGGDNDTKISPSTTPFPTSMPTTYPPTMSPTIPPLMAFASTRDLYNAVDEYVRDPSPNATVASHYGYPIGAWNVSLIEDFSRVFEATEQGRNPALRDFDEDLSGWDTNSATTMFRMFRGG